MIPVLGLDLERANPVIQKLLDDHVHMRMALDVLESEYSRLAKGEIPDIDLMLNIVVYLQEYSEQAHHPLEDIIFSMLLKRDQGSGKKLRELISDHTGMEVMTRHLRATLESMQNRKHGQGNNLGEAVPALLERQRRHMQFEEEHIFPLIHSVMSNSDWDSIRSMSADIDDPVFGVSLSNNYKLLYHALDLRQ